MKTVLIIGGGFAGLEAAIFLRKSNYDVTLVSERDYFFIYPTSIWIPTREQIFEDVCIDLNALKKVHGFNLVVDALVNINAKQNFYTLASGEVLKDYDHVILAMGASKMKHKGIENTLSICGAPEQSIQIRDSIEALIEKGSGKICFGFGGNPKDTSAVRGGPAFELLFNIHNLLKKKGIRDNFELTFFAPMPEPGKRMGQKALKMMAVFFKKLGINQHFGKKIKAFEANGIIFEDDTKLESDFTMFIAAGDGHNIVRESDLPTNEAGFITIDDQCHVVFNESDMPTNIYAIGDIAALEGADWRAKQGHVAEIMARNVAFNIAQKDQGKSEFKGYQEHINILCIMDSGNGASFIYRDNKRALMIPLPIVGHWLKKGWGVYCKLSKLNKIPRIPGI
ncbi:sulfide-quinone oxidoreductase [Sulfurimonas gotlandica GD1]|uniref:Sulfide-quinone oxidoreductase n=1 Tax=Sulfurimonas gotlandica (strain DSM 19862 / JCM 16533 / GD1) TaxID=929558 RepID=B6BHD2_SULGG|nr:FAD-dependent oxidoreductase [Sulfurimonas gotlandica]EDZ63486.1 sulfide-quinone reductase [Sulfurimonas gotlandica GD1]EHP29926.1 sulfide-quinone oxidoreductase [Sulfurimonas gotlandica GD1]